jgi:hypothetical protein
MSGLVGQTALVCKGAQKGAGRCEKAIDEGVGRPSWRREVERLQAGRETLSCWLCSVLVVEVFL